MKISFYTNKKTVIEIDYEESIFLISTHETNVSKGLKYKFEFKIDTFENLSKIISVLNNENLKNKIFFLDEYGISLNIKEKDIIIINGSKYSNIKDKNVNYPILSLELIIVDE